MRNTHFLYYVRTKFLNGECADIADELPDDRVTETTVVEIKNILHNLQRSRQEIPAVRVCQLT